MRTKNENHSFILKYTTYSFDCINPNVSCTQFKARAGETEVLFDR